MSGVTHTLQRCGVLNVGAAVPFRRHILGGTTFLGKRCSAAFVSAQFSGRSLGQHRGASPAMTMVTTTLGRFRGRGRTTSETAALPIMKRSL